LRPGCVERGNHRGRAQARGRGAGSETMSMERVVIDTLSRVVQAICNEHGIRVVAMRVEWNDVVSTERAAVSDMQLVSEARPRTETAQ
jgi:hypothetical protein